MLMMVSFETTVVIGSVSIVVVVGFVSTRLTSAIPVVVTPISVFSVAATVTCCQFASCVEQPRTITTITIATAVSPFVTAVVFSGFKSK